MTTDHRLEALRQLLEMPDPPCLTHRGHRLTQLGNRHRQDWAKLELAVTGDVGYYQFGVPMVQRRIEV